MSLAWLDSQSKVEKSAAVMPHDPILISASTSYEFARLGVRDIGTDGNYRGVGFLYYFLTRYLLCTNSRVTEELLPLAVMLMDRRPVPKNLASLHTSIVACFSCLWRT